MQSFNLKIGLVIVAGLFTVPRSVKSMECATTARPVSANTTGALSSALDSYVDSLAAAGLSGAVLVARNDTVLDARGFGYANIEKCIRNSDATLFDIGSIVKSFTAVGIAQQIEKGRLKETDPVSRFFKDVPSDKAGITVGQLLTHTSGLQSFHDTAGDFEVMSRAEALRRIFSDSLRFAPGTKEAYSNSGYTLLGMILENVTGVGLQTYFRNSIFAPSGIKEGWFWGEDRMPAERVALGYVANDEKGNPAKWPLTWAGIGASGIVMDVRDLFRFAKAIDNGVLISRATDQSMQRFPFRKWAEGWEVSQTPYGKLVMKGGASEFGFTGQLRRYVDRGVTVVFLLNSRRNDKDYPHVEVGPALADVVFANLH
jgi:CubicO group peptidase (beta-lactamase class C family)